MLRQANCVPYARVNCPAASSMSPCITTTRHSTSACCVGSRAQRASTSTRRRRRQSPRMRAGWRSGTSDIGAAALFGGGVCNFLEMAFPPKRMARHHRRPTHLCAPVIQWGSIPKCKHEKPMRAGDCSGRATSAERPTTLAISSATSATTSQPANVGAVSMPMSNSRAAKSDLETGSASHATASALLTERNASTATSHVMGSKHSSRSHPSCSGRATGSARNVATTITRAARGATAAVTVADDTAQVARNGPAVCLQVHRVRRLAVCVCLCVRQTDGSVPGGQAVGGGALSCRGANAPPSWAA
eukprot:212284-Prymnesium_polylepis.2